MPFGDSGATDARKVHLIQTWLIAVPLPVFAELRLARAEVMADDRWQMAPVLGSPLLGEHHVVMRRSAQRIRIGLLRPRVPKLEESDGHVTAQQIDVARRE